MEGGLEIYDRDPRLPSIEASLERKRMFVEEFFTSGELAVAYMRTIDHNCPPQRAKMLATQLIESDKFVRDLMGLARKNVVGSVTALLAEHTSVLAELRDEARADGKYAPAIAAEIARGKALGLYDRVGIGSLSEKKPEEMSTDELRALIDQVSRLPDNERQNIADLLMRPNAGLLEGDFQELGD